MTETESSGIDSLDAGESGEGGWAQIMFTLDPISIETAKRVPMGRFMGFQDVLYR